MKVTYLITGLSVLLAASQASLASEAYRWTDEQGTTHFSEAPPADAPSPAEPVELLPPSEKKGVEDDYFSVINQANRMQEQRLQSEKIEAERKQAEAEAQRATAEAQAARDAAQQEHVREEPRYYPGYPLYGYRQPYDRHPGLRYRPPHDRHPGLRQPGHGPSRPGHFPARPGGGYYGPRRGLASF